MMQNSASQKENRRYPRMAVDCAINFRKVDQDEPELGQARNISGNGMLFISEREISVGSLLEIQVKPGNPSIPALDAIVEVVRVNSGDAMPEPEAPAAQTSSEYEVGAVILSMK